VEKVRVYHDRTGNTITVWFDDPRKESICEEIGDDIVLIKDQKGRVIGFERLNYLSSSQRGCGVNVPVAVHVLGAQP
jgi:uncharacterized protein YuzE